MSKKNSSAILKNGFKDFQDLEKVYINFKNKLSKFKSKNFLVAISGGPDSLALAALSKALSYEKKISFQYILINHNIRKNSAQEANQVKKLLKKYFISLKIFKNNKKINKNIQGEARNVRYEILTKYCYQKKIKTIITAHNLEDQVETFLIRLSRGSGLKGLSSMRDLTKINNKIYLLRPFLNTKKIVLIKIAKTIFGKFFKDPSNRNTKYLRTRIRNLKKPLSYSGISYDQIIKSINNLASSNAFFEEYFNKVSKKVVNISKSKICIDLKKFKTLNSQIKIMIINDSIKKLIKNYYNPRSKKVISLIKNIDSLNFKSATLGGCLFFKKGDQLCLIKEKTQFS